MKRTALFIAIVTLGLSFAASAQKIVSGSTQFSVKFVLGTCNGTFDAPKGLIHFDETQPNETRFDLTVSAASFKTNNNTRDKDMKSEKYFFVSKYPEIRFKSTKVSKTAKGFEATGTLTIKDVSKTVTLPFTAVKNDNKGYTLSSSFQLNRLDYHIGEKDWKLKDVVTVDLRTVIQ